MTGNRGKMLHLILTICQKVEKAFNKIVDGGEGGELGAGSHVPACVLLRQLLPCSHSASGVSGACRAST